MIAHRRGSRPKTLALRPVLLLVLAFGVGCGDRQVPDEDLGALVVDRAEAPRAIDVDQAATDTRELRRALEIGHSEISKRIGAHRATASSSVKVASGGDVVTDLSDETTIDIDAEGNYVARADNNRDYGRHAIFVDGVLFLRPRYGKYHRRAPSSDTEPESIRDEMFSVTSAYFDMLYAGLELSDRGAVTVAGRPGRKIDFKRSPTPKKRDPETLAHKTWRNTITVEEASGTVTLADDGGFALAAQFSGAVTFVKEGKTFTMDISAAHTIDPSAAVSVSAPGEGEFVTAPTMRTEVEEQKALLGPSASEGSK